jgi:hypothetical protein
MGDAEQLRSLIAKDADHRALYEVFLAVRDAAAQILEHTTIADIVGGSVKKGPDAKAGAATKSRAATKKSTGA